MRNAIVVDVNGTLSDVSKVVHHISGPDKNWDAFFDEMNDVQPNPMVVQFVSRMRSGYVIVLVSGAPERFKPQTEQWLRKHGIRFDAAFFRPDWDKRKGWQFKQSLLQKRLKNLYNIKLVLDDKQDACDMYFKNKIPCWKLPSDADPAVTGVQKSKEPGQRFLHLVKKLPERVPRF
jgi:hypothetical protein